MEEIWKDVKGYEGLYKVSNLGRVKSLPRKSRKHEKIIKGRVLSNNRVIVCLQNKTRKEWQLSRLIFYTFNGYLPSNGRVVDHHDNNPLNNSLSNLKDITQRLNTSKDKKNKTSSYTGVSKHKKSPNWIAQIYINNKSNYIGTYKTELEAKEAYDNKLKQINYA